MYKVRYIFPAVTLDHALFATAVILGGEEHPVLGVQREPVGQPQTRIRPNVVEFDKPGVVCLGNPIHLQEIERDIGTYCVYQHRSTCSEANKDPPTQAVFEGRKVVGASFTPMEAAEFDTRARSSWYSGSDAVKECASSNITEAIPITNTIIRDIS